MEEPGASRISFFPHKVGLSAYFIGGDSLLPPRRNLSSHSRYPSSFSPFFGYRPLPLIGQLGLFFYLFSLLSSASVQAEAETIGLETVPSVDQLRPLSDPVKIILSVLDSDGKPVQQGRLHIRLVAPAPGWLFSTDLPLVEGADLLEMDLPVSQGQAAWEYTFPIRGVYHLEVRTAGMERLFDIGIKENRVKLFYLGIFVVALFFFGFMAGRLFTSAGRISSGEVRLGFFLLAFGLMLLVGEVSSAEKKQDGLVAKLEVDPAVVGQPSQIRWRLAEGKGGKPVPARLTLTITHLEEGRRVFFLDRIPTNGEFKLRFHFTDGAPYRITSVTQVEGGKAIQGEREIAVAGIEPPPEAIFPSLFFFVAIIALGLVAGRISRRKDLLTFTQARTPSCE